MRPQGTGLRRLACVLTAALAGLSGCVSCLCPVAPVSSDTAARCAAMPQVSRNHVYIFLVNGECPFDLANLGGLRDALISLGYTKTYRGEWYHTGYFKDEIRRLRRQDESARFVVMGVGQGAGAARDLADAVRPNGATVDLLVYCGGDGGTLAGSPSHRPSNALRVIRLVSDGADTVTFEEGVDLVRYPDGGPFGSPTGGYPMEVLARELMEVASNVRVVDQRPPAEAGPERGPPPRAVEARELMPRDDWDFLKPTLPYPRVLPKQPDMPKAP